LSEIDPGLLEERLWALEERRFASTRIQLTSVTDLGDALASIIEIGPGSGHFSSIMKGLDYAVKLPTSDPEAILTTSKISAMLAPRRLGLGWFRGKHSTSTTWEWARCKDRSKET
jgi:hypothetical protein